MNYGRVKIYTDAKEITADNVKAEVEKALVFHVKNQIAIDKLWDYYRGKTAILKKKKEIRPEINHKINENRAYEIVKFHKGYVFGEPIQYVRRENSSAKEDDNSLAADINALNGYMSDANKAECDNALAEWMYIAGTAYRLTLPNRRWTRDSDHPPFLVYSLDPRKSFVVYSSDIYERPMFAVCYAEREDKTREFSVYTERWYFEFKDGGKVIVKANPLGMIPIVEYPAENARLGVFEPVLPLFDALNELQSNRLDDIVQFVNSFLAVIGAEVDSKTYDSLNKLKMLLLPPGSDAKYLSTTLSQSDVQTLKNDLCQTILTVCGVPNRNGGTSTSDTGSAVILRDGWEAAEARAKATEAIFISSEKETLKIVLRILRDKCGTSLKLADIIPHFTRRNYENIATKAQVLISMLSNPLIHPEVSYAACGMFPDPESAYLQGMAWNKELEKKKKENDTKTDTVPEVQPSADGPQGAGADTLLEV